MTDTVRQSVFKLYRKEMIVLAAVTAFLAVLFCVFIYRYAIAPLYDDELEDCLNRAKQQSSQEQVNAERDHCLRTHPPS